MKITKKQLKRIIAEESRKLRRLREDAIDSELDHLKSNIADDIEHIKDLKDDVKDDHEEELRAEKAKREDVERKDESIARHKLRSQIRAMLQEEQGYDAREDDSLGAKHGAVRHLDLHGDEEDEERSRRDDAHFEDRTPEVHVHIHDSKKRKGKSLRENVFDGMEFEAAIISAAADVAAIFEDDMGERFFDEDPALFTGRSTRPEWMKQTMDASLALEEELKTAIKKVVAKHEAMLHDGQYAR